MDTGVPSIFIRHVNKDQAQFITLRGKWVQLRKVHVGTCMIPSFVDPALVAPIIPYLPADEVQDEMLNQSHAFDVSVPREVSAPLVSALKEFWDESQAAFREHATVLDNAHNILAHATDLRFGLLDKLASKLIGKKKKDLTPATLYAVRTALMSNTRGFNFDRRSHFDTQLYQILSHEQVETITKVREWMRDFQNAEAGHRVQDTTEESTPSSLGTSHGAIIVRNFISKVQTLIDRSRERRPSIHSGVIGPSLKKLPLSSPDGSMHKKPFEKFDDNEKMIIKVFEAWSIHDIFIRDRSMSALPPVLLRATGKYDDLEYLHREVGYVFLQEIGVLEPFANKVLYDVNLLLPSSQHSRPLQQLDSNIKNIRPEKVKLVDGMADLRHDWKELNVFCIDKGDAAEIDDGISIERIPGSSTQHWVHVHIANPTAFITNGSVFGKMASHLTETFYSPDKNFYLLPHWMSTNLFSLQPNRPCLTFSARLNSNGEILETKVQPAIVRKVHSMSYEEVNMYLKKDYRRTGEILVVGGEVDPDPERPLPKLTKEELDDLKLLQQVAHARFGYRVSKGSLYYDFSEPELEVFYRKGVKGLPKQYPHRSTGHYYVGDPIIKVKTAPFINWFGDFSSGGKSISDAIVRECMLLASEISAKWASQRNIPLLYRGILNDGSYGDRAKFEREVLRPAMDEHGSPPMWAGLQYIGYMGVAITKLKPIPHMALGLNQYTKTTSPLRRYTDMITHWQIEATLRHEARLGRSLVGQTEHLSALPFSNIRLSTIMNRLVPRERLITRSKMSSLSFWYAMFAYRAMICNELPMKRVFNIIIVSIPKFNRIQWCSGLHMDYGLRVHVVRDQYPEEPQLGDVWEYELQEVNVYNRVILGRLLRLISRKEL